MSDSSDWTQSMFLRQVWKKLKDLDTLLCDIRDSQIPESCLELAKRLSSTWQRSVLLSTLLLGEIISNVRKFVFICFVTRWPCGCSRIGVFDTGDEFFIFFLDLLISPSLWLGLVHLSIYRQILACHRPMAHNNPEFLCICYLFSFKNLITFPLVLLKQHIVLFYFSCITQIHL